MDLEKFNDHISQGIALMSEQKYEVANSCNINISIPEVYIPNIEMPVLRAA